MADWFEWNGTKCTEKGIIVSEHPSITIPQERVEFVDVPGRSGSLTKLEGDDVYDDMTLTARCFIADPNSIPALAAWLRGSGKVTFGNRPNGFYYARIVNQIPFEKILRGNPHRSFAVNFRCKPFFYHSDANQITITESTATFTNPGTVYSLPKLTVTGSGEVTLMLNGKIIDLDFTGISGSIVMDSELEECLHSDQNASAAMSGEFFRIPPGENAFAWTGNVTSVVIDPNWRSL